MKTFNSLDQDFIVFRGNDYESAGQLLKGVVVLCLPAALRIEDVRLRLVGTLRLSYVTLFAPSCVFLRTFLILLEGIGKASLHHINA